MIDEDATFKQFGYKSTDLKPRSGKKIVVVCDRCKKVRVSSKHAYHNLCKSCANKKRFEDPKEREKASAGQKKRYEDPKEREKASIANKKRFEDPKEREKASIATKKHYEDPKERRKQSEASKKYHKDHPKKGKKHSELMKKRYEDPKEREKASIATKKHYEDPKEREKASAGQKKRYEDPKEREKASAAQKNYNKNHPKKGKKQSELMKKRYEDPKEREKASIANKKRFEDPKERKKLSAAKQGIPYDEWESFAKESPYCPKFNQACRESNREKYGRKCFICGKPESDNITKAGKQQRLSVHHVDMDKMQGCDGHRWRLIPTCIEHHNPIHSDLWMYRIIYLLENVYSI